MRLKRLVARGFKSFADRTEFEFDSRLTGIIGPNGCGKSNVVDAIKWVLGDQRAKSLRGTEMTDVIFKGAEGREAMGMAEVTITFEDPEGKLEGRTEIDISRRLTLEKESTYLLNGTEVRLKDVRDVLLDTGLGTGGYSVMEQGRIDAVLSANPEARRAIFEEAAGISRFKLQKKETLRKLERTDQNLARVTDLLEERSRRIRSLRIQAGKARRFQELQSALRDLRSAIAVIEGTELRSALHDQRARLAELEAALDTAISRREEFVDRVAETDATIGQCAEALESARAECHRVRGELNTQRERAQSQSQRRDDLRAEAERGRARGQTLASQRMERGTSLDAARDELTAREEEAVDLGRQLEEQKAAAAEAQRNLRALSSERESIRSELLELLHARTRARNAAADQEARLGSARGRSNKLGERLAVVSRESAELQAQRDNLESDRAGFLTRERFLREREERVLADLRDADSEAAELASVESELRRELSAVDGRRQALVAMEAQFEGLDQGPKHVLSTKPEGLRGRLVDLLEIDLQHSTALEAALGSYVQALVVDTRANAARIIQELQEKRLGRVLLLVEEEFAADPVSGSFLPLPASARSLFDLVRPAGSGEASRRMLAWLLRGVVLVDSLEHADATRADLCFVTSSGQLLCGPRVEGGHTAEGQAGLVVRRSQIQELQLAVDAVSQKLASLQGGKERAVSRVDRLKAESRLVGAALQEARRHLQGAETQLSRVVARAVDVAKESGELEREADELSFTMARAKAILGKALCNQHLLSLREQRRAEVEAGMSDRIAAAESVANDASIAEQDLRLQQAKIQEGREGLLRTIRMHEEALREIDSALEELADSVQKNEDGASRAETEAMRFEETANALDDQLVELEERRTEADSQHESARQQHRQAQQDLSQCDHVVRNAGETMNKKKLEVVDLEHRFLRLEDRLREETGIELMRCLGDVTGLGIEFVDEAIGPIAKEGMVETLQGPPLPPSVVAHHYGMSRLWETEGFDAQETRREIQVLQSQKDRLGAVNLDAVAELDAEEGQFGTLEQEVQDLKEARRALMDALRKLEVESKTLFEQTFAEARKNFQDIFRKLFQGGKADMFLHETDDLLEAGIEIVAQPPGKQLQSINLLSGGERSLTAVAILFALFKVRPSPFCILDEVDAALDETNVERFLRVLRDFTHGTQFCIVTHHKRTMADCQALYGITMQRRGVSSRIAVNLSEVDSFQSGGSAAGKPDPAKKQRIAGEEAVGFG